MSHLKNGSQNILQMFTLCPKLFLCLSELFELEHLGGKIVSVEWRRHYERSQEWCKGM